MTTERARSARLAVRVLFAAAVAVIVANFLTYFTYYVLMPAYPDFEAGRITNVRLGGQLWVYVTDNEALIHRAVQEWLGAVGMLCMLGAILLHSRSRAHQRDGSSMP